MFKFLSKKILLNDVSRRFRFKYIDSLEVTLSGGNGGSGRASLLRLPSNPKAGKKINFHSTLPRTCNRFF
jgi:hypothetical protein